MNPPKLARASFIFLAPFCVCLLPGRISSCGAFAVRPKPGLPKNVAPARNTPLSADQLKRVRPNEAGMVPILEYHEIGGKEAWMVRSKSNFNRDLNRLYREGYRPITMAEYLSNRINLPPGKSPIVLTFDDSRGTQFRYGPHGALDPDCAVAVLKRFHEKHTDFAMKATFFVLPICPFDQPPSAVKKLRSLVAMGFDIGNHTLRHWLLHRLSDKVAEREIGGGAAMLHKLIPKATIDTLAFPGGNPPRNSRIIAEGHFQGFHYVNRAGFLAYGEPAPAPAARHQDRMHIRRIVACEDACGITYWLDLIRRGEVKRYVSDGDPETTTVPRKFASLVDSHWLNGAHLRVY